MNASIEIGVTQNGTVEVCEITTLETGERREHYNCFSPGADVSAQSPEVRAACASAWTPDIIVAYQASIQQPPAIILDDFQESAKDALAATSVTMERIVEGISLGTTTANAPDVVAWMNYRKALRDCITATVAGTLPNKPPYPAGT